MGFLDNLDQTITGWGQSALKKTKDVTDTVKIQSTISGLENRKKETLTELGRFHYNAYKEYGGNLGTEELHMIETIMELEQQIQQYSKQLQRLKGVVLCPNCHAEVPVNSKFCSGCGTKMPIRDEMNQRMQGARKPLFCQNCGTALDEGQRFCTNCGTPIENDDAESKDSIQENEYNVINDICGEDNIYDDLEKCETLYFKSADASENELIENIADSREKEVSEEDSILTVETVRRNSGKTCPNCGNEVSEDTRFCTVCGTKIV